jgi:prepilin-type N-terminal cleavage/methylation domain-containing protein
MFKLVSNHMHSIRSAITFAATSVAIITGAAGFLKLIDVPTFQATLESWALISASARPIIAWGLPAVELWLGALWLAFPKSKLINLSLVCLFFGMLFVIVSHLMFAKPPTCGCLGLLSKHVEFMSSSTWLIAKAALCWLTISLFYAMCVAHPHPRSNCPPSPRPTDTPQTTPKPTRAFTLIEVLVVVGIIAILISLSIPALAHIRQSGRMQVTLSNLRQSALAMTNYTAMYKGQLIYPIQAAPEGTYITSHASGRQIFLRTHFQLSSLWSVILANAGTLDSESSPTNYSVHPITGKPDNGHIFSCSLLAHPEFWNPLTRLADQTQWVPPTIDSVRFPSKKVMFFSNADHKRVFSAGVIPNVDPRVYAPFALIDGSVRQIQSTKIRPGSLTGEGGSPRVEHSFDVYLGLHTIDGVRGLDF